MIEFLHKAKDGIIIIEKNENLNKKDEEQKKDIEMNMSNNKIIAVNQAMKQKLSTFSPVTDEESRSRQYSMPTPNGK